MHAIRDGVVLKFARLYMISGGIFRVITELKARFAVSIQTWQYDSRQFVDAKELIHDTRQGCQFPGLFAARLKRSRNDVSV